MIGTGWDFNFAFLGYTETWRKCRRIAQQALRPDMIVEYQPIQAAKTRDFLRALLEDPNNWMEHNRRLSGAIIMAAIYGYDVALKTDYFISIAEHAIINLSKGLAPGTFAVNSFPVLQYLPSWFPGCGFHKFAAETRELTDGMRIKPFRFVQRNMEQNTGKPSLVRTLLEMNETRRMEGISEEEPDVMQKVAATLYAGGADTTVAAMGTFILAMALYPNVVAAAQEQLDHVVGRDRLPIYEDQKDHRGHCSRSPQIQACGSFGYRPYHCGTSMRDSCLLSPNLWAMSRDENMYPEPEIFNPDKFFNAD
ncbi:cytochrome P450 [Mycena floridula]|nr:cytochrome P450 [Mycena floridula]